MFPGAASSTLPAGRMRSDAPCRKLVLKTWLISTTRAAGFPRRLLALVSLKSIDEQWPVLFDRRARYYLEVSIEWLRNFCLSLPHTTEQVQWEDALVFKVAGKMYAVASLEPGGHWLSLKCCQEEFAELIERPGIVPAPYLARAHWVALESENTLPRMELAQLLTRGHSIVLSKLPRKTQLALAAQNRVPKHRRARKKSGT